MAKQKKVVKEAPKPEVAKVIPPSQEGPRKVKVTQEELMRLQEERRLIGYDPLTCEATIR